MRAQRGMHKCDNCEQIWHNTQIHDVSDLENRLTPGGIVPSGQCPDEGCTAPVYPMKDVEIVETLEVHIRVPIRINSEVDMDESYMDLAAGQQSAFVVNPLIVQLKKLANDRIMLKGQIDDAVVINREEVKECQD